MSAKSIEACLNADKTVAGYTRHAVRLLRARQIFRATAPAPLAAGAHIANFRLGRLVIYADNNAIANKLKQLTPTLTQALSAEFPEITEISISTQPKRINPERVKEITSANLGVTQKQGLTTLAEKLPPGDPLRQALQRFLDVC